MERIVQKMILLLGIAAGVSRSEPPVPNTQYGVPANFGGSHVGHGESASHGVDSGVTNSYGAPLNGGGHDSHQDYVDNQPKSYEFGYAVKDAVSGNDFGRRETSDGETVRGEYRVQLPDGRTQIVTYTADWRTGFHADVRYEGVASYPEQYNNNNNNNHNSHNNGNGYNNGGTGYNDLNTNSGFNIAGYNGGSNDHGSGGNNYHSGSTGNYNSGFNSNNNNYGTSGQSYNGNSNNYNGGNSLDGTTGYNYPGYSSNSYDSKAPIPSYGTPAYH